jgi:tetratricopeptide (TPR) repeat protein
MVRSGVCVATSSMFLLYVTIVRVAMIAVGGLCIYLGYRLFALAPSTRVTGKPDEFTAAVGKYQLKLRHAAPGSAFALFGTALIVATWIQSNPQMTLESLSKLPAETSVADTSYKLTLRGSGETFAALVDQGVQLEREGRPDKAAERYEGALASLALPMTQLANYYLSKRSNDEALGIARLAASLNARNAAVLDTAAQAARASGNRDEALRWITKAAQYDGQYQPKVAEFKEAK